MYKKDLALNNLQWFICHQTKPNHIKSHNSNEESMSALKISIRNIGFQAKFEVNSVKREIREIYL